MISTQRKNIGSILKQWRWWLFFLICAFYGVYAFHMGAAEMLSLLGIAGDAPHRAAPYMFVVHALSGSVALISGGLQLDRRILSRRRKMHRVIGRIYVGAIWISSVGGLWNTIFFEVNTVAKMAFGVLSILWFSTTTITFLRVRHRRFREHREWMVRSFALSLFFVTFSFWVPGLGSTNLLEAIAYPLGVFLSWILNLIVAELWIHRTRAQISHREPVARY